jgi:hypothetical protein
LGDTLQRLDLPDRCRQGGLDLGGGLVEGGAEAAVSGADRQRHERPPDMVKPGPDCWSGPGFGDTSGY